MEIKKLRRLWYLSTVPTHSPASLAELHRLVREASARVIACTFREPLCELCENFNKCAEGNLLCECLITTPKYKNFELRMEEGD